MNQQKLYRSNTNKVFAGVCGGVAEYFDVDPVLIRIFCVLLVIFGGTGILLYIACIFIIPLKPYQTTGVSEESETFAKDASVSHPKNGFRTLAGYILVILGLFFLLDNLGWFSLSDFFDSAFEFIIPILLIIAGMAIIYYRQTTPEQAETYFDNAESKQLNRELRRSSVDKKIFGVCGGLARYFNMDSSIVRILYVILCLVSFGAGIVLYVLMALFVPDDSALSSKARV